MEGELSKSNGSEWCTLPASFNMTINLQIPRHMGQAYFSKGAINVSRKLCRAELVAFS
jgi:hypothetical protein